MNTIGPTFAKDHNGAVCIGFHFSDGSTVAVEFDPTEAIDPIAVGMALEALSREILAHAYHGPATANPEPSSDTGA